MAGADLKVLFIMGLGRCGSTILDNLVGGPAGGVRRLPTDPVNRRIVRWAVCENPGRFETGTGSCASSRSGSPARRMDRVVITAMALPFLPRYRYSIFPGRTPSRA